MIIATITKAARLPEKHYLVITDDSARVGDDELPFGVYLYKNDGDGERSDANPEVTQLEVNDFASLEEANQFVAECYL